MLGKCRENGVAELSPNCMYQHWLRRRRRMRKKNRIRISVLFNRSAKW
jgi:hypothetical protein